MYRYLREILLLILLPMLSGGSVSARSFIPSTLEGTVPAEFGSFVDRYLTEMLTRYVPEGNAERRMKFDEVEVSFPLTESATRRLADANGIYFIMEMGKRYRIVWMNDSLEIGNMSFPASYTLITGKEPTESFNALLEAMLQTIPEGLSKNARQTSSPDSVNIVCREGREFYLGHLNSHKWIDGTNARPVWSVDFPVESLSNLMCMDNMPDTPVEVEMLSYKFDKHNFVTSLSSIRRVLGDVEKCDIYFGAVNHPDENGMMEAMAVFHNPSLCYIHKLDLSIDTVRLFDSASASGPSIKATLYPYVKLHNLKDLWGDKTTGK